MYKLLFFLWLVVMSGSPMADEYPAQFCNLHSGVTPLTEEDVASAKDFFGDWDDVSGCRVENNRYAKIYLYGRMRRELSPRGEDAVCYRTRLGLNAGLRDNGQGSEKSIEFPPPSYKSLLYYTYLVWILPKDVDQDCGQVNKMDAILLYHPVEKNTLIRLSRSWKLLLKSSDSYRQTDIENHIDQLRLESIELAPFDVSGLYVLNLTGRMKGECKRYQLSVATTETGAFDPVAVLKGDCGRSK